MSLMIHCVMRIFESSWREIVKIREFRASSLKLSASRQVFVYHRRILGRFTPVVALFDGSVSSGTVRASTCSQLKSIGSSGRRRNLQEALRKMKRLCLRLTAPKLVSER